jgi:cobalt-zinc-cadmium efflux system outer membrane protein
VRFPDRSPLGTYLDIGALEDVLDIVLLPARKKLAEAQYQEAKARIVAEVLETAAQARMDFVSCQAAAQMLALEEMDAKAAQAAMVAARQIRAAGNMDDLTFAQERENEAMADIELADARATEAQAREKENDELGLSDGQLNWTAAPMPQLPAEESLPANLETAAVEHRPAIAAAQREIVAQARMLGLTADLRFFSSAEIGPEFERETDGQWRIGPSISVPVPLFDLGDAKVSRAQASLREAEERCVALIVDVRSQVRAARREMLDARAKAVLYRDELIPIENDLLRQTELRYNGMLAGVFQLLSARRQQVEAQANYIGALRDYWIGRIDLERAIGGRIESAGAK